MPYVHEIFKKVAAGDSLYSTVKHLTKVGAPAPKGGKWHPTTLRNIVQNDTYLGTFYYGKDRYTTTNVAVVENGVRTYKRKVTPEKRPRSEWIGVPVPDSGIPSETVARAREALKGNVKSVSKNGGRIWELSGGVGVCAECGKHMIAHTSRNSAGRTYYYYRCSNREPGACSIMKHRRAGELENMVMVAIADTFQPETWESFVHDLCDRKLEDLHRLGRSASRETLVGRMRALETKLDRARELFIDGDLPRPTYEEKKSLIQEEIEVIREELTKVEDLYAEVRRVEDLRETLLSIENPMSGHYVLQSLPEDLDALEDDDVAYGSRQTAARRRQEFYRRVGMKVKVGGELEISLGIGNPLVCKVDTVSGVIAAPTPAGVPGSLSRPLS
jgi:hypothetical protein